jgi:acetylornithine deacetylase
LLRIERRTVPGETAADVEAELREILAAGGANDASFRAELRMGLVREPFSIGEDAAIVRAVRNQATARLKRAPAVEGAGGWMDSALLSAAGIPTVIFGPLGAGAHADIEWVDLDHAATCVEVYTGAVKDFCG